MVKFITALEDGGFSYHEEVPTISPSVINPVQDSDLSIELSLVAAKQRICPSTVVIGQDTGTIFYD